MFRPLTGRFWRAVLEGDEDHLLKPARGPEGRWHYGGQPALYCSDDPEGCRVSINSFAKPNDPKRQLFPIDVKAARIIDLRDEAIRGSWGISLSDIHAFWNDHLAKEQMSPTWEISDRLRKLGAQGILSPSRSMPEFTHLTLFSWNCTGGAYVTARLEQSIPF